MKRSERKRRRQPEEDAYEKKKSEMPQQTRISVIPSGLSGVMEREALLEDRSRPCCRRQAAGPQRRHRWHAQRGEQIQ